MQAYEELKQLVAEIETDINKAEGGNKAAGTRVRKQMQMIKQASQNVRNTVQRLRQVNLTPHLVSWVGYYFLLILKAHDSLGQEILCPPPLSI